MTIEEMKAKKAEYGFTNEMIARVSGVPLGTVQKIFSGFTKTPRRKNIEAIEKLFREADYSRLPGRGDASVLSAAVLKETAFQYNLESRPIRHTIQEYYALPEDQRVELIDGKFYEMAAPSYWHQKILGELFMMFRQCADAHGLPCEVLFAPFDVRLDRDNFTMVQPDLVVICNNKHEDPRRHEGAPELVVEILSPSTRRKDLGLKLQKYQNAGVREYWVVDPKRQKVIVNYFEAEDWLPEIYGFGNEVPVHISGGACRIDFSGIAQKMEAYQGE